MKSFGRHIPNNRRVTGVTSSDFIQKSHSSSLLSHPKNHPMMTWAGLCAMEGLPELCQEFGFRKLTRHLLSLASSCEKLACRLAQRRVVTQQKSVTLRGLITICFQSIGSKHCCSASNPFKSLTPPKKKNMIHHDSLNWYILIDSDRFW